MNPTLSPSLFALFTTLVEEACGLHYGERERELFSAKLVAHAEERGFGALLDFYYRLRYDDPGRAELDLLVEALLVHETYFFRELAPLQYLADTFLPGVVRARGRARVWSAACSSGEEPFTLAMLLADRGLLDSVDLLATDISEETITRARAGRHSPRSVRDGHPPEVTARHLEVSPQGVRVAPKIRAAVRFATQNLVDGAAPADLGAFDVILCRNVLIYFRDDQISRVIDRLAAHLAPGGLLTVGVSESLLRFGTKLVCEQRGDSFFYGLAGGAR